MNMYTQTSSQAGAKIGPGHLRSTRITKKSCIRLQFQSRPSSTYPCVRDLNQHFRLDLSMQDSMRKKSMTDHFALVRGFPLTQTVGNTCSV